MLLALRKPTSGKIQMFGSDPYHAVKSGRVGAMLQSGGLMPEVTVRELVTLVTSLHPGPEPVDPTLKRAGIAQFADQRVDRLSGGQTQRVRFALAICGQSELIVLDEPTTAMDVETRRLFWASMKAEVAAGRTLLFATHYLEEYNQKFEAMWAVQEPIPKLLDHRLLSDLVKSQLKDPIAFISKFAAVYADPKAKTDDVLEFKDGRVFERHSEPQTVKSRNVGRVWGFRDVTELRERNRQLQELARVDSLTGIRNRRSIFEFLSSELARQKRSGEPLTVIMADLDGFKKINDRFGHAGGDTVLKETARRLRSGMRLSDAVGRYGGEEFLIVLPGCDEDSAQSRAEEFRRIVEIRPVSSDSGEIGVTCSFGVAWIRDGIKEMSQLLQEADAALYRAKHAGKNCVVIAGNPAQTAHERNLVSVD